MAWLINPKRIDFWLRNKQNVLFIGKHGVGKTSMVIDAFRRAGLVTPGVDFLYYSAATMDPWADFVGVPVRTKDPETDEEFLDYVRPRALSVGSVRALFFDEFNRSHMKVRNAVMECIQFKSINGRIFPNLEVVWAAINPEPEEHEEGIYDVERLDPAQKDRFQVQVWVPYRPCTSYFNKRYGKDIATSAIAWWKDLPDKSKELVSPRRLDYALDMWTKDGNVKDVLPPSCNAQQLVTFLIHGPVWQKLQKMRKRNDVEGARRFLASENNYHSAKPHILREDDLKSFCLPLLDQEKVASLCADDEEIIDFVVANSKDSEGLAQVAGDMLLSHTNRPMVKRVKDQLASSFSDGNYPEGISKAMERLSKLRVVPEYDPDSTPTHLQSVIDDLNAKEIESTNQRKTVYEELRAALCQDMSIGLCRGALEILNKVIARFEPDTLVKLTRLICVLNHIVDQLQEKTGKTSWEEIYAEHGDVMDQIIAKLRQSTLAEHFIFAEQLGRTPVREDKLEL